mmetsp:Transcript_20821/g.53715  ORF Transcript_20821/g.53715 Transcript_20821/m.53715 type:complete len:216 (+) Transcript_20821:319-966(+)
MHRSRCVRCAAHAALAARAAGGRGARGHHLFVRYLPSLLRQRAAAAAAVAEHVGLERPPNPVLLAELLATPAGEGGHRREGHAPRHEGEQREPARGLQVAFLMAQSQQLLRAQCVVRVAGGGVGGRWDRRGGVLVDGLQLTARRIGPIGQLACRIASRRHVLFGSAQQRPKRSRGRPRCVPFELSARVEQRAVLTRAHERALHCVRAFHNAAHLR